MQKLIIKKKKLFTFYSTSFPGLRYARLHIRRNINNIFLTLTDLKNNVIVSLSLGQSSSSRSCRIKRSPITFDALLLRLRRTFKIYKLRAVTLLLRSRLTWQLNNLQRIFFFNDIRIIEIEDFRRSGHGFLRPPKLPRK